MSARLAGGEDDGSFLIAVYEWFQQVLACGGGQMPHSQILQH